MYIFYVKTYFIPWCQFTFSIFLVVLLLLNIVKVLPMGEKKNRFGYMQHHIHNMWVGPTCCECNMTSTCIQNTIYRLLTWYIYLHSKCYYMKNIHVFVQYYMYAWINTHLITFMRLDRWSWWYFNLKLSLRASWIGNELLFTSLNPEKNKCIRLHPIHD